MNNANIEFYCIATISALEVDNFMRYIDLLTYLLSCVPMSGCLDGPSWVSITPMQTNNSLLEQEDILRCASDGNPLPVYTWLDATTGERIHVGEQLTFDVCRHFICDEQCVQNNLSVTLQCVATVAGHHWTNSVNTTATFSVDPYSYNLTCGTLSYFSCN